MNFEFYTEHIKTICDLQKLAEKHDCKLSFGINSDSVDRDIDVEFLKDYLHCPPDVAEELCDRGYFDNLNGYYTNSFFELYDKKKDKYNILKYFTISASFDIVPWEENDLSQKALDWLMENSMNDEWNLDTRDGYRMVANTSKESVYGFEDIEKEGHIYREGIMLAVFTQLVCDYLGEERIIRVY